MKRNINQNIYKTYYNLTISNSESLPQLNIYVKTNRVFNLEGEQQFGDKKNCKQIPLREWLDVGTVPTFKKYNIETVPTFKKYNIGTVPTFKKYNIGTLKIS